MSDRFAVLCDHVQRAGSAVAAALLECESVAGSVVSDAGAAGDLAAIRRNLLDAARLLDRAERLSYPIEPEETR